MKTFFDVKRTNKVLAGILLGFILMVLVIAFAGCGGGGGGISAPTPNEYPVVAVTITPTGELESPTTVRVAMKGSTSGGSTVVCRIGTWGDGSQPTAWTPCNDTIYEEKVYRTDVRVTRSIRVDVRNEASNTTAESRQVIINPTATAPGPDTPTYNSFGCDRTTMTANETLVCSGNVSCPAGRVCRCVTDFGDGTVRISDTCSSSHQYTGLVSDDVTFTITSYPEVVPTAGDSTIRRGNALTSAVRVRTSAINAPVAPNLASSFEVTVIDNNPNYVRLVKVVNTSSYELSGSTPTNCDRMFVKQSGGAERSVTSFSKSTYTWRDNTSTQEGLITRDYYCKNVAGDEGAHLIVEIKGDRTAPNPPTVYPVTSPTTVNNQTIEGIATQDCNVHKKSPTPDTVVSVAATDDPTTQYNDWSFGATFSSAGTYSYTFYCEDNAGNKSADVTVQIRYNTDGSGGGGGSTDPDAPTISCSHSVNSLTLTATCSISGSGCTSASMAWGDSSSDSNISCSGSTVSHTYPSSSSYTYTATVNSSSGSNTYSRTIDFSSGGGTNYALLGTCTVANSVDITSNGSEIFALTSGGQVRRYDTDCGDETVMNVISQPEGFGEAVSLSYCTGNNRITVADRLRDKVYIYTVSGDDMTYSHAITTNLDAPDDVFCSNANDIYVLDRGNRALKKFNAVGTQQCAYDGWGTAGTDIAVDNSGNIYTTDHALNRVLKLTSGCAISTSITGLSNPRQLAIITAGGELWVGDNGNNRISIINPANKETLGIVAPSSAPLGMAMIGGDLYSLSGGTTIESFGPQ